MQKSPSRKSAGAGIGEGLPNSEDLTHPIRKGYGRVSLSHLLQLSGG